MERLAKVRDALRKRPHVKVGFLGGNVRSGTRERDEAGRFVKGSGVTNAALGALHELGSADGRIPARPFLHPTVERNRREYLALFKRLAAAMVRADVDVKTGLDAIGAKAAADVKKTITDGLSPPNAPSTVAAKGSSKPLVDTGQLVGSITWAVEE